jgi:hypothetical protein
MQLNNKFFNRRHGFFHSKSSSLSIPQYLSPKFTDLWAKYPTRFPIARKYETFPSLQLVHTEKKGGTLPLKFANLGLKYWGHDETYLWQCLKINLSIYSVL